ncbi:MAG: PspC domain-containing protein [Tissierella sp.]|uniref:PspC domain-containing protein n=1 Tax=Tissierella sp. TaxID=41274 RepID=UPI003F96FA2A
MGKKLYRSEENKMIAGVCGGIGEYFNVDPTLIRLAWAILSIPTAIFGGVILYLAAAIIIPSKYEIGE